MAVHVFQREPLRKHQYLQVIQQLTDLFSAGFITLVFGGHPYLCGLLDDLLSDAVHTGVEAGDGVAACGPGLGLLTDFGE